VGSAVFPILHDNPGGEYCLGLRLDPVEARALIAQIEPVINRARELAQLPDPEASDKPSAKRPTPSTAGADGDSGPSRSRRISFHRQNPWTEEPDGSFLFSGIRSPHPLPAFDQTGGGLPENLRIGHGSTLRIAMDLEPWFSAGKSGEGSAGYGVRLVPRAIQVIDLKPWSDSREENKAWNGNASGGETPVRSDPPASSAFDETRRFAFERALQGRDSAGAPSSPIEDTPGAEPGTVSWSSGWMEVVRSAPEEEAATQPAPGSPDSLAELIRAAVAEALGDALAALGQGARDGEE
jgi:hypothetical protein